MIVEEIINGPIKLCRYHDSEDNPEPSGQWILTSDGEIKGLIAVRKVRPSIVLEFYEWARGQEWPVKKMSTIVRGVAWAAKRFGFKEYVREK